MALPRISQSPVRRRRLALDITQVELAFTSGVSLSLISAIERGMPLTPAAASKLAAALQCPPADLLPVGTDAVRKGRL
jgi:transcriptional regulator with XRE-family HTH domain